MSSNPTVDVWATAKSTRRSDGWLTVWRFAKELNPNFNRSSQPYRFIIVWKYQAERGIPVKEEHDRMNAMEHALDWDSFATLALVSTGDNLREWTYYARSEDEFMERLDEALADDMEEFPIEIHSAHDPEWSMYEEFRSGVVEK
jgi:Family of unknown function (DUF695)